MKRILVLAGASGVGKTTVAKRLLAMEPRFSMVRSMTTRPPRDTFREEYLYVDDAGFDRAIRDGELLEHTEYAAYRYGTPYREVQALLDAGRDPLLVLDLCGVESMKKSSLAPLVYTIYLYEDPAVLQRRLYKREDDPSSLDAIQRIEARIRKNREDYLGFTGRLLSYFDLALRNSSVEACAEQTCHAYVTNTTMTDQERAKLLCILHTMATSPS